MKTSWKKILMTLFSILILTGIVWLMLYSKGKYDGKKCTQILCTVDYEGAQKLIYPNDIKNEINKTLGKQEGRTIEQVEIRRIVELLDKNPFLEKSRVAMGLNGVMKINVTQRTPILRYITKEGRNLYLDKKGNIMPVYPSYVTKLLVATGNINKGVGVGNNIFELTDSLKQTPLLQTYYNIHKVAEIVYRDSLLSALIEQVDVAPNGYMQLVTKLASHIVVYGDTTNAEEKFDNLKHFYQKALPKVGWNKYKKINLQYKNQVVCTK